MQKQEHLSHSDLNELTVSLTFEANTSTQNYIDGTATGFNSSAVIPIALDTRHQQIVEQCAGAGEWHE